MGEKEQGAARESSAPSLSERKSGSVVMRDRAAEGHLAGGDPDFDTGSKSLASERPVSTVPSPDTDLPDDLDDDTDARTVTKTSSNIQNNRGAVAEDGSDAARSGPVRLDPTPARLGDGAGSGDGGGIAIGDPGVNGNIAGGPDGTAINNSHSNIKNLRSAFDDPGAGGDPADIAVSDEGVPADKPSKK